MKHPRLVARERQLEEVRESFRQAGAGDAKAVILCGEAGIGKTALAEHVLGETDFQVFGGRRFAARQAPFGLAAELLRDIRRSPQGAVLGEWSPQLNPILREQTGGEPDREDPAAIAEAFAEAVMAAAGAAPTIVFIDDLQNADENTLECLPVLLQAAAARPLVLLCTLCTEGLPRRHPARSLRTVLKRLGKLREITLTPLGETETALLLADRLGGPVSPALGSELHTRSGGLPFFLEELADGLRNSPALIATPEGWSIPAGEAIPLPESVRDILLQPFEKLSPPARAACEAAATLDGEFSLADLCTICGSDTGFDELMESRILLEVGQGKAVFRHAMAKDAIYAEIPWTRRTLR